MCTEGRTDSYHEANTCFSEMSEKPDRVHNVIYVKYLQGTDLRLLDWERQSFEMI